MDITHLHWEPRVGDRVHVVASRTLPAFNGLIVKVLHDNGFNVRDAQGCQWFRSKMEIRLIEREENG
jgi:hypothetical protein